ncbi:hypothetical protein BC938DRAFT_482766 [Jimgerdemannia flammicorona]|uniref:Uncharacterized protein n=1 Tax=Jimgerdemannia flammicorona TaxID=994334 RepID=A0A433QD83_9FUNG|nr:hypothetical protein BC938DRAFT_482766 [Jimgerdemannia flammicorona]
MKQVVFLDDSILYSSIAILQVLDLIVSPKRKPFKWPMNLNITIIRQLQGVIFAKVKTEEKNVVFNSFVMEVSGGVFILRVGVVVHAPTTFRLKKAKRRNLNMYVHISGKNGHNLDFSMEAHVM